MKIYYANDQHQVCEDFGFSEWTLTGTTVSGKYPEERGTTLPAFNQQKYTRRDSFWKILE